MPAELSREMLAELDRLEPSEAVCLLFEYVRRRHRLLGDSGKLVAIIEKSQVRKVYLELGMSPKTFDLTAA